MKHQKSKKTSKKFKFNFLTTNKVFALAIVVLLFATIIQSYFTWYMWQFNKSNDVSKIEYLIHQALDGLYEIGTNQVVKDKDAIYIPSARITLPLSDEIMGLSVNYNYDSNNSQADMNNITYSVPFGYGNSQLYNATSVESLFAKVPMAQACTRQMTVLFNYETDLGEEYQKSFTKTLQDGRVVNGYVSTKCTIGADELSNYVSQMQSY